ncbi:MAG: DNA primase [Treponema sp.]|jgi:DNA primase|nr:DNA primase [Treponema sp.]
MSRIAKSTIQEVNDRLDAIAVVEDYVRLEKKGGRYWGLCPFHNEKTPSFTVDPDRKMYHCFGCGQGGGIVNFVMEMDKLSFPEAIETLARRVGVEMVYENSDDGAWPAKDPEENNRKEELAELYRRVTVSFRHWLTEKPEGAAALNYILGRGISREMISRFRLGYAPADRNWLHQFLEKKGYSGAFLAASGLFSDRYPRISFFSDRLVFPIADRQGKIVAFGGRLLSGEGPKYLNSRESERYKKGQTLFAIDLALPEIRKTRQVYLAEGYMDVIALHQAGLGNAVAPLGTAFTGDQAKLLRRWAETALLVFDADEAGQNAAVKAILTCRKNGLSCAVVVPGGAGSPETAEKPGPVENFGDLPEKNAYILKDPADILKDFGPRTLKRTMECYINDFEYLVNRGKSLYDVSAPEGKARAAAFLFPYLETLDSEVSRDGCFGQIADAFGVDRAAVLNDYNRRRAGEKNFREEVPQDEKPVRMNDELFLLTLVSVNFHLYPQFRSILELKELEDPAARDLFIALEECFVHEETGMEALLSRIDSAALRRFVLEKGASGEFSGSPEELLLDGVKILKKRRLQRRLSAIVSEMRNPGGETRLEELISEKMYLDGQIRELEGK